MPLIDPGDPTGFQRKGGIFVPGEQQKPKRSAIEIAKGIIAPVKRLLTRQGQPEPEEGELQYAVRFNHARRRWNIRFAARMRRRQVRAEIRKQVRLDRAMHNYATQRYDPAIKKIVRLNSKGEPIAVVSRPPLVKMRSRIGYLQENGPAQLHKTPEQVEFEVKAENGNHVRAVMDPKIDHLGNPKPPKRQKYRWGPKVVAK